MSTIDYQKEKLRKAVPPPPKKKEKKSSPIYNSIEKNKILTNIFSQKGERFIH